MFNLIINPFKSLFLDRSIPIDVVFFSIILILIPVVLITGPALPDIFLSVISFYILIKSIYKKYWHYFQNPLFISFLIFSIYGIIRSIYSEFPLESLTNEGSVFYFRYIFFALGVWHLIENNPYLSKCLLFVILFCLILVCADGLYQYLVGTNILGNKSINPNRLTGFFGKEHIIGRYIAFLSLFAFALIYQNFKVSKLMMFSSVSFLVMCEVVVFLSGERSPLFYLSLFTILIIIFIPQYRIYRVIGVFFSIFIIFSILQINTTAKTRMIDVTIKQISETSFPFLPYSEIHEQHYVSALKMFKSQPFFGVGTNTFRYQCEKKQYKHKSQSCTSHPHNYYFQVLAELGILGFLFLIIFFAYITSFLVKQFFYILTKKKQNLIPFDNFLFIIMLFVFWWPLIPNMSIYNNWNNVLIMLPLGFFMKYLYSK